MIVESTFESPGRATASGVARALLILTLGAAALAGCAGRGDVPSGGTTTDPPPGGALALMPARIRRLSNAEYDGSVQALLGTRQTLAAATFPPDARQGSFTLNDAQRVDPVLAKALADAAQALAAEARQNGTLSTRAPCANTATGAEACARTFIQSFGAGAYRRPLTDDEVAALVTIYEAGATGGSYLDGAEMIVRALLQSAGFLYITELGDAATPPASGSVVALTASELGTTLSYLATAAPPDQGVLDAAAAGQLGTPDGREQQLRRLLASAGAGTRLVRVVREWLGIDGIADTAKDTTVYPAFAGVRASMDTESVAFVTEVLRRGTGTVSELLGADWSVIDGPLAAVYGAQAAPAGQRTTLTGRRGILNQGAFLSVFAHASESAPVLRGVAVMRRVACIQVPPPTSLNIVVTPPVPDPTKSTRQRFDVHATDQLCQTCHQTIDAIGFTFEEFDGMGQRRGFDGTTAGGQPIPVDSATTLASGTDFDGSYADSSALAAALAASPSVRACAARQLFRASAGRSDATAAPSEDSFVQIWQGLPEAAQGNIVETLVAYVRSPLFGQRRIP
jgi:Protein of unknown function (DUF1592)/Protein of unknown function (DUF1588)/Protein of unknown function (DUF1595)/Protein of unknown function (DUF1587)